MATSIVFIDNMVLSWLMQPTPGKGEIDRWKRANQVPSVANENGELLAIAAPALAEFLTVYELKRHKEVIRQLGRSFQIHPLDANAASIAAALRATAGKNALAWKEARDRAGVSAQELKTDILIVATSIAAGAKAIVTHDDGMLALADHPHVIKLGFEIRGLPRVQTKMFEDTDNDLK